MDDTQRAAVAHVLHDIDDGSGVLYGRVDLYDVHTGVLLAQPRPCFADYLGFAPAGLPAGWELACAQDGRIAWDSRGGGIPRWLVTDAGRRFVRRWLPAGPLGGVG